MPTPLFVIRALAEVRESSATNMLNRRAVEMLVEDQRAAEWLDKASDSQYMEALNDMGAALSDDWMGNASSQDEMDDIYESYAQARNGEEPGDETDSEDDDEKHDPMHYDQSDFSDDPDDFTV